LVGALHVYRQEVRPFSEKQIVLLQNFAAQAVIAIENARLINETREALEQKTATAEVLQVINSSPGELEPVFQAMLAKAMHICDANFGVLFEYTRGAFRALSSLNVPPAYDEYCREARVWGPETGLGTIARTKLPVHILDVREDRVYAEREPNRVAAVELGGVRTVVIVPMLREGELIGTFAIFRQEVRAFTGKQIELVSNFGAQAVIAMENARLITETREALEQQTATTEVLQVINSSPGDLSPVFNAMLEKATRLCNAAFGIFLVNDGEQFRHVALRAVPSSYRDFMRQNPPNYGPDTGPGRILAGEYLVHVHDMMDTDLYRSGDPNRRALVDLAGARSVVLVPLRKEEKVWGIITVYRQEMRPFSRKHIELLQNFAAQAVIAMENARLITETREALEQQTATAEVLQIINSSPGDLSPVFDAMLERATRLCEAAFGTLLTVDGDPLS
jgi:GAF domain-containing protein